jgi:hypothetical protein
MGERTDCTASVAGPRGPVAPRSGTGRADTRAGAEKGTDGAASGRSGGVPERALACRSGVVDSPELVRVRALLYALRPDPRGTPLGWGPYERPPPPPPEKHDDGRPVLGALAARIRVQTSPEVPSILPCAFASRAGVTPGTLAAARIDALALDDEPLRAALFWLQRHGTLAAGLGALYESAAQALADDETREGWAALEPARRAPAHRGFGRRQVLRAADLWEGRITWMPCTACPPDETACARCRGRGVVETAA